MGVIAAALSVSSAGFAQERAARDYNVASQDLKTALREVTRESGLELLAIGDDLRGKVAPPLNGHFTPEEAIAELLRGTGLTAEFKEGAVYIRGRSSTTVGKAEVVAPALSDIVVTGSRIRGAPIASPVIVLTNEAMTDAGQTTLKDVIRDIPQNFGGGVNLGVGVGVPEDKGTNLGGGSSLNLRGLGSDATLTLLNGHRLAYNVSSQAVDISTIPLAAVDRIEIVVDGASALYGSDAVGGVANIILKRDYRGLELSARQGWSTDGGNREQQLGAVVGTVWNSGGFILAYDFERDLPVLGAQRDYAASKPALTLYPFAEHHNFVLNGHQAIGSNLTFQFDGLFNSRRTNRSYATTSANDYRVTGAYNFASSKAFAFAPSLRWALSGNTELALVGFYGRDRTEYGSDNYLNRVITSRTRGCYCNGAQSIELNGQSSLFALPGGKAKVAFGVGYRNNDFHGFRTAGAAQGIRASQDSYYGFAEIDLPFVGTGNDVPGVSRLNLSAAVRYEDYPGIDKVATPKIGLIYSPTADLDLKGSWGKSFKAPTLYQQYNLETASIYPASLLGAQGVPSNAAAILLTGGNPKLRPEHAESWTATLSFHPHTLEGFTAEVGYFNVRYRDRIVSPITFLTQSLSNPIYRDLVNFSPSAADKTSALADAAVFNYTGGAYDPATVVAIIGDNNVNVASQKLQGADASVRYRFNVSRQVRVTLMGSATYLESQQKLSALQPSVTLAGTIFNPPHFRSRLGSVLESGGLMASIYANYIGPVSDVRSSPAIPVGSMTTADVNVRYAFTAGRGLARGLQLSLSIQNLNNADPSPIKTTQPYESPYDSTNYSALGRVVSLSLSKKW